MSKPEKKIKPQKSAAGSVTADKSKLIRATQPTLTHELFQSLLSISKKDDVESKDEFVKVLGVLNPSPEVPILGVKGLMRQMFKLDHPYRTQIGYFSAMTTNASGVVNLIQNVSSISSAGEWGVVDSLFDEFFIHAMTLHFQPVNLLSGGWATFSGSTAPVLWTTGTTQTGTENNCGIVLASLFNGAASYTTANGMVAVPNRKFAHSGRPWKYAWRNNQRFDPRGPVITGNTSFWKSIGDAGTYQGFVQVRAFNDQVLGDGTHAMVLGHFCVIWDISFRVRA